MNYETPNKNQVTITNIVQSGAGFAIKHGTGESCYIPQSVVYASGVVPGDVVTAALVTNPHEDNRSRTPYLVVFVERGETTVTPVQMEMDLGENDNAFSEALKGFDPKPKHTTAGAKEFTRKTMLEGGVWTNLEMFREYVEDDTATRDDNPQVYGAIGTALRTMFEADECAKWSMWRKGSQSRAGRDWFSCYPQFVEVAEFEDAVQYDE